MLETLVAGEVDGEGVGRVSSVSSGENEIQFGYRTHGTSLAGRRWLRNGSEVAAVSATYDAWDNVSKITFGAAGGETHSIGYIYDMANRRTQTSLPDGTAWRYGYDRLSQVVSGDRVDSATGAFLPNGSHRYTYDGLGNRVSAQEGSAAVTRKYTANSLNQYTSIFTQGVIPIRGEADAEAKVAVTVTIDGVSTSYLAKRDGQEYSLDIPVDNSAGPVSAAVQVDALKHDDATGDDLHRRIAGDYTVAAATPEAPAYDADGNLLACDGWTYTWNGEDRLASATKGTTRLEFSYDYLGRRFEKKVFENDVLVKRQLFVYDGFKQIAEYDVLDSNALANTYLWQPVGLDVPLLRNGEEFYGSDANKNIVALIDATGDVTDTYVYAPFGACTHTGASSNPFRFSSEYHDDETALVYYNYRYYSPDLGRWLSRDPIEEVGASNLFSFCFNNSIKFLDYSGKIPVVSTPVSIGKCITKYLFNSTVKNYIRKTFSNAQITNFIRANCIENSSLPTAKDISEYIREAYASSVLIDAINSVKDCISDIPGFDKIFTIELKIENLSDATFQCDKCSVKYKFSYQPVVYLKVPFKKEPYKFQGAKEMQENSSIAAFYVCCQ